MKWILIEWLVGIWSGVEVDKGVEWRVDKMWIGTEVESGWVGMG